MAFTELNSTTAQEPKTGYGTQWVYQSARELERGVNEVLVESELKAALVRLNPEIAQRPELGGLWNSAYCVPQPYFAFGWGVK